MGERVDKSKVETTIKSTITRNGEQSFSRKDRYADRYWEIKREIAGKCGAGTKQEYI